MRAAKAMTMRVEVTSGGSVDFQANAIIRAASATAATAKKRSRLATVFTNLYQPSRVSIIAGAHVLPNAALERRAEAAQSANVASPTPRACWTTLSFSFLCVLVQHSVRQVRKVFLFR